MRIICCKLKGIRLVGFSVLLMALVLVCSFTPILWVLGGREDESYPELIAFIYGLPCAVILLVASVVRLCLLNRRET